MKDDAELHYMPLWTRDHLVNPTVSSLSLAAEGAYIRLLCYIWLHDSIPKDLRQLAHFCNTDRETMADLWEELEGFFEETEQGELTHPRLMDLKKEQLEKYLSQVRGGKKRAADMHGYESVPAMEEATGD